MALTEPQRFEVWRDFMAHPDLGRGKPLGMFGDVTKHDIRAIVDALGDGKKAPKGLTKSQLAVLKDLIARKENPPVPVIEPDARIEPLKRVLADDLGVAKEGAAERLLQALGGV